MINKAILTGRIVNNIELRKTNDGIPFTYFTIAINRNGNSDQTDFISCIAWRGTAEFMQKYMNKGSLIGVEGRIESFRREKDGNYETITNVNVSQIHFLESKSASLSRTTNSNMTFAKENKFDASSLETTPSLDLNDRSDEEQEEKVDFSSIEF